MRKKLPPIFYFVIGLFFLIFNLSCKKDNFIEIKLGKSYTVSLSKSSKLSFKAYLPKNNLYKITIDQTNIDIAVKLYSKDGDFIFIDRPTYRYENESFYYDANDKYSYYFDLFSVDSEENNVKTTINIMELDHEKNINLKIAEREYFSGLFLLNSIKREEIEKSIPHLKNCLTIYKNSQATDLTGRTYLALGRANYKLKKINKALDYFVKSNMIFRSTNHTRNTAISLGEVAACHHNQGNLSTAKYYYFKSLVEWKRFEKYQNSAYIFSNLSYLYYITGEDLLLEMVLSQAVSLSEQNSDLSIKATASQRLGSYYANMGRLDESIKHYKDSLNYYHKSGLDNSENFLFILNDIAQTYSDLGNFEEARTWCKKALHNAKLLNSEKALSSIYWNMGQIELFSGNPEKSIELLNKSLQNDNPDWKDNIYLFLFFAKYYQIKQTLFSQNERHLKLIESLMFLDLASESNPDNWTKAHIEYWRATVLWELEISDAFNHLYLAIQLVEQNRQEIQNRSNQISFLADRIKFFQLSLKMHINPPNSKLFSSQKVFQAAEKIRARTLLDIANEKPLHREDLPTLEEVQAYHRIQFEMEEHFHDEAKLEALEAQLIPLAIKMDRLDPTTYKAEPEDIAEVDEVQKALKDDTTLLLSYAFGLDKCYLLALDKQDLTIHELGQRDALRDDVQTVSDYLKTHPLQRTQNLTKAYEKAAQTISNTLFEPLKALPSYKRLVFVADDYLQRIPLAALPYQDSNQNTAHATLGERFEIAMLPSASVWMALKNRAARRSATTNSLAILANPVFNAHDSRLAKQPTAADQRRFLSALPGTQREAEAIAALAKPEKVLLAHSFDARTSLVKSSQLNDYRYVHFATHGTIDPENPNESRLILSRYDASGAAINGNLTLNDISQLQLQADLVSLSACETATGKIIRGEGLISLARGFMAAGVPSVLGTLWKVPDDATAVFMTEFYRALLQENRTPSQALQQAQIHQKSQNQWRDPHFWAGFVLIGDWQ